MMLKYDDKVFSQNDIAKHLRRTASPEDQTVRLAKDKNLRVTETSTKLYVRLVFGDSSKSTISLVDPKNGLTYSEIQNFVKEAVESEAFANSSGVLVTGFDSAYVETTTKTYLEE